MASVDVAIPCYQYGRYLRDCVASVLRQGIADVRVLVIDNASTDDSLEVAQQLAAEDSRVEIVAHGKNLGPQASYNEAVDWADRDYFLILDADDLLAPGCLSRALAVMERHPEVSFTCGTEAFLLPDATVRIFERNYQTDSWKIASGDTFIRQLCRTSANTVAASSVVRRTSAQKKAGHYRPGLPYSDDVEMWMRLATLGHVARTPAVQAVRRLHALQHGASYTFNIIRDFEERQAAFDSFFENEGARIPKRDDLVALARRGLGEHAYWAALAYLCRGQLSVGSQLLRLSLECRPSVLAVPPVAWLLHANRVRDRVREVLGEALFKSFGYAPRAYGCRVGSSLQALELAYDQQPGAH